MMGKTHTIFSGGICGLSWVLVTQPQSMIEAGIMVATTAFGGLLPDIDHPQASISRKNIIFGAVSRLISSFEWGKHRRVVHTLPFCILFFALGFFATEGIGKLIAEFATISSASIEHYSILIGAGFFIGAVGHLIADTFNKEGVMWLWPFTKKRISIAPITTSSMLETVFCVLVSLVSVGIAFSIFKTSPMFS